MKNKDFKRLGDDTKKMEKNVKLYHTGLIINLIIIAVILVLAIIVLFFKPDLFEKNATTKNDNTVAENDNSENKPSQKQILFSDFKIVYSGSNYYIIGNENGQWKEITEVDETTKLLDLNDNKLYYYNSECLGYVNFETEPHENVKWIKYSKYKIEDSGEEGVLEISDAYMVDDKIYFKYNLNTVSPAETSGVLLLTTNDVTFRDAIQVVPEVTTASWQFDEANQVIYYIKDSKDLYKYDTKTASSELVLSNIKLFNVEHNKILYIKPNDSYREIGSAIVQAVTYELYLYDINTKDSKLICECPVASVNTGSVEGFSQYYNEDVYYKSYDQIIKYDNGANTVIYTYTGSDFDGFEIKDNGIIAILLHDGNKKYIVNNELVDEFPKLYSVIMKDGSTKDF